MNVKKIISIIAVLALIVGFVLGFRVYQKVFKPNTNFSDASVYVYIPSGSEFSDVKEILKPYVDRMDDFVFSAESRGYDREVFYGKFQIKNGMNNFAILSALKQNLPVKLSFNNQETLEKFAERIDQQLEPTKEEFLAAFKDTVFLRENGFNEENILAMFIPNTYEFYWNVSETKFRDRLSKEYRKFWNEERLAKAKEINLTPIEVSILASIVHKETVKTDERPRVAGAYMNRLKMGMPLQADPTVIYAVKKESGDFDQVIKRVLYGDLKVNSPYNTYMNIGLPPGPIAMPDITAIDAVLNYEKHDYIYFCASVEKFGYHEFASNLKDHGLNRKKYVEWIEKQNYTRDTVK